MKWIFLFFLITTGCLANSSIKSPLEIYNLLTDKININEDCFYQHNENSSFVVDEVRLTKTVSNDQNEKIVMALCMPGAYQDHYVAFAVNNNNYLEAQPLIFAIPLYDEKSDNWKLVDSEVIPDLIYPQEDGKFIVYNKSSGRGTCGYVSHYDLRTISEKSVNKPIKIYANDNCSLDIGWDEWPEIKFN